MHACMNGRAQSRCHYLLSTRMNDVLPSGPQSPGPKVKPKQVEKYMEFKIKWNLLT